jgi:hypothetical protein
MGMILTHGESRKRGWRWSGTNREKRTPNDLRARVLRLPLPTRWVLFLLVWSGSVAVGESLLATLLLPRL